MRAWLAAELLSNPECRETTDLSVLFLGGAPFKELINELNNRFCIKCIYTNEDSDR